MIYFYRINNKQDKLPDKFRTEEEHRNIINSIGTYEDFTFEFNYLLQNNIKNLNIVDVCEDMDDFTKKVCSKFFELNKNFIILKCTAYLVACYAYLLSEIIEIIEK